MLGIFRAAMSSASTLIENVMLPRFFTVALLALVSNAASAGLPPAVVDLLQASNIPQSAIGAIVLRGDSTLLSHGAASSMQPASTMKLLTSMVALEQFGPAFRARTELRSSAELVDGVLAGDLILRGGADPDFDADALKRMLQVLRNQGISTIRGDLILDRTLFQPTRLDLSLAPFDESPELRYNVIPDALLLNTNLVQIDLRSTAKKLTIHLMPQLENVTLVSDLMLQGSSCARWTDGWNKPDHVRGADGQIRIVLRGSFPQHCSKSASLNLLDRNDYADRLFRASWRRLGGAFKGSVREVDAAPGSGAASAPPATRLLAEHVSRALPEVLRDINKSSDNTLARMLYLSLGSLSTDAMLGSRPISLAAPENTALRADLAVRQWLQRHDIDDVDLVLENGSGLSRLERISPAQMAAVLQAASNSPWAPEFLASLPIVGLDGTMRNRLGSSPASYRARIKTGTLKNVTAIAGYVQDADGRQCVVVAMINHDLANQGGRAALDALIDWVASSSL
jgi:D-alanyl-D-alanine carboxypeptidase/D-alanyl-D-alanine-endopeptidase (penicillin-binding protein 4)